MKKPNCGSGVLPKFWFEGLSTNIADNLDFPSALVVRLLKTDEIFITITINIIVNINIMIITFHPNFLYPSS